MIGITKNIFTRTIMVLMMVFVCLSCAIKREIKQTLNIPIASLEHSEKPDKTIVCANFTKNDGQKSSKSYQKKDLQKHHTTFNFAFHQINLLKLTIFPLSGAKTSVPIPIYILHEQYLI